MENTGQTPLSSSSKPARSGVVTVVLHAHLPYIRHPEWTSFYEETWLYEAISETYLPLLRMMDTLEAENVGFRLTMSVTPPLCEMLADTLLRGRFASRLDALERTARKEAERQDGTPLGESARFAAQELESVRATWERWDGQVLAGLRHHEERGCLELMTCAATHGYLPLMATDEARRAQIAIACDTHARHFGRRPRGIWLPECAYAPDLEWLLADAGIRYFFLEKHGLLHASPPARFGTARPVLTESGVAAFARDPECSNQIWSAESGYPGDPYYREFYRDLGYDGSEEQVGELLTGGGFRHPVGLKYHRITGRVRLDEKAPYLPLAARYQAAAHASDFLARRQSQLERLGEQMSVEPVVVAPFDAELFGHWWFEGPMFLEFLFRKAHFDQTAVGLATPCEVLDAEEPIEVVQPAQSSWGDRGYYRVWLNEGNAWFYKHLHAAEEAMIRLAITLVHPSPFELRAVNQAARELLLAQSSDWAFLVTMATAGDYPKSRTLLHLKRFQVLVEQLDEGVVDVDFLLECERRDNLFANIDYREWRSDRVLRHGAGAAVHSAPVHGISGAAV